MDRWLKCSTLRRLTFLPRFSAFHRKQNVSPAEKLNLAIRGPSLFFSALRTFPACRWSEASLKVTFTILTSGVLGPRKSIMGESLLNVVDQKFKGELVSSGGSNLTVVLEGTLSQPEPQPMLDPFFASVHSQATSRLVREVKIDMMKLEFMNSAAFKSFLTWIALIQAAPSDTRYNLSFQHAKSRRWQSTSVHALKCFGPDLVNSTENG